RLHADLPSLHDALPISTPTPLRSTLTSLVVFPPGHSRASACIQGKAFKTSWEAKMKAREERLALKEKEKALNAAIEHKRQVPMRDRKSTRLNSSHVNIS